MKKFLISLIGSVALFGGFFAVVSAHTNNDCRDVEFNNGTVCVAMNQTSNNHFELQTDNSVGTMRCDLLLPDNSLRSISSCNGSFTYNGQNTGKFKLYIRSNENAPTDRDGKPSSNSQRTYPQWMYDFDNGEFTDSVNNNNNNNNNSNGDLDNFYLTTDDSSPSTYQYVDLNIKARDSSNSTLTDFSDTVKFKVYYGNADNSSWTLTTSSSYYAMASNYNTYGYNFDSSDNGYAQISNAIEFKNTNYDYKVRVYDENDTSIYKDIIFYVNGNGNGNGNGNNNNNSSSVDGFTSTELSTVQSMYDAWPSMITNLKNTYSILRNSTARKNRSDTFYDAMKDILDDVSSRTYDTYDSYYAGFLSRYNYTISIR